MKYFDSHAHYYDERFSEEMTMGVDDFIDTLLTEKVSYIINIGASPETSRLVVAQAKKHENMYSAVGIHPSDTRLLNDIDKDLAEIRDLILDKENKVVCLGEIGLDYHYPETDKEKQLVYFERQMQMAEELGIPVCIHDRESHADVMEVIRRFPNVKGVLHSFSGSIAFWREATPGQGNYRVVAQSVSKEGELLWGEEGLVVEDFGEYVSYGDLCLQSAHDGEIAAFYMRRNQLDYGNVDVCMQIIDTRTAAFRWEESPILTSTQQPTEKNEIQVTDMLPNGSWIFCWDDRGVESNPDYKRLYIHRANYDGSVGNPDDAAVTTTYAARGASFTFASQVDGKRAFTIHAAESTSATLTIYNVDGTYVAMPFSGRLQAGKQYVEWNAYIPAGIYLATLTTTYGVETIKILVK